MLSSEAASLVEDNSLTFLYIDGNHGHDAVKEDLEVWYPKLKRGGLCAGHGRPRLHRGPLWGDAGKPRVRVPTRVGPSRYRRLEGEDVRYGEV